jgi:hypothetical protein
MDAKRKDAGQVTGHVRQGHPHKTQQRYQHNLQHKGEEFNYSVIISNVFINAYESSKTL